jgi:hypothetical protein
MPDAIACFVALLLLASWLSGVLAGRCFERDSMRARRARFGHVVDRALRVRACRRRVGVSVGRVTRKEQHVHAE